MKPEIELDEAAAESLREMSAPLGIDPAVMAARLVKRSIRADRLRPVFIAERLKAYAAENEAEELALAESDVAHRAELLAEEERA